MESRILLVEDSRTDEVLTLRAFKRAGFASVVVTRDGQEALDFLFCRGRYGERDPRDMPSLIMLDINMPRLGGIEALKAIRADARTSGIPVLMMISSGTEQDVQQSSAAGANHCVRKPIDIAEFLNLVNRMGLQDLLLGNA